MNAIGRRYVGHDRAVTVRTHDEVELRFQRRGRQ
jgi:hypothetical protein